MSHGATDPETEPEWVAAASRDISSLLGIEEAQARQLALKAFNNGRDAEYLSDNLKYVRSAPKVKRPARLFAMLVKSNQHKTGARATKKSSSNGPEVAYETMESKAGTEEGKQVQEIAGAEKEIGNGTA